MASHPEITNAGKSLAEGIIEARDMGRELNNLFEKLYRYREVLQETGVEIHIAFKDQPPLHAAWIKWFDLKTAPDFDVAQLPEILQHSVKS